MSRPIPKALRTTFLLHAIVAGMVFSTLGAAAIVWGIVVEGLPPFEWLNAVLLGLFAVAFAAILARMGWQPAAADSPPATLAG